MFNQIAGKEEERVKKAGRERLAKIIPIAKEVLNIIGTADVELGELIDKKGKLTEDTETKYKVVAEKILVLFLKENIEWADRAFIFQLVMQAFEQSKDAVVNSMELSYDRARTKVWGKDFLDLNMEDINKVLTQDDIPSG